MKNKKLFIIIKLFFTILFNSYVLGDEFNFEGSELLLLDNGNKLRGINGVNLTSNTGIKISGKEFVYDKISSVLKVKGDVLVEDELNNLSLRTEEITYLKLKEIIFTKRKSIITFDKEYLISSKELTYNRNKNLIFSKKEITIKDKIGNNSTMSNFEFTLDKKVIKGNNIKFLDEDSNKVFLAKGFINLLSKEISGKDPKINFNNTTFNNVKNEPRLKGKSFYSNGDTSVISKGVFTTCQKRDKCPPWVMSAEKVSHDKKNKRIYYKNSWLRLYDFPVFYFPKFFHPDPTVKRQSGFLIPRYTDSSTLGSSLTIPYYNAISEDKDLTFKPRLFANESALLQAEFRNVGKNSKHTLDSSYFADKQNSNKHSTKTHFFSNSKLNLDMENFDATNIEINLQQTSSDTYLKTYKVKSPLIESESLLHSFLKFNGEKENFNFNLSTEVYEDLSKKDERFEYIYPNFEMIKKIYPKDFTYGSFSLETAGYQKKNNTNVYEAVIINDLFLKSNPIITKSGFKNKYTGLIKNVNTDSKRSTKYKDEKETQILGLLMYEMTYPSRKKMKNYDNIFTPTFSFRYSPNKTRDIISSDRRIDINNIYTLNRIGENDTIEGGQSITIGSKFKKIDKSNNNFLTFDWATSIRDSRNEDLPIKSTINEKYSDVVGKITLKPTKIIDLSYDFSYDNNLKYSNYDSVKTKFSVNNFFTEFEFLEENNLIGKESFLANKTGLNFSENKSFSFSTRKNKETDATEFYNLIYEYKNDCLVASIEYNRDYYNDSDLKPEEQLFFSITIVPFGKTNSPNIN